jgi:hypothetical protein
MKRLLLLAILIGAVGAAAPKAEAVAIEFTPASTTVSLGDSVDLDVVVTGLGSEIVSTFDLLVSYDPAIVSLTALVYGPNLGTPGFPGVYNFPPDLTAGLVSFAAVSFLSDDELDALQQDDATGRLDPLVLATLSFTAVGLGTTALVEEPHPLLGLVDVKGRDGQVLPLDNDPGRITVVGGGMPPTPVGEPSVLLLFAAGLATIARGPKRA